MISIVIADFDIFDWQDKTKFHGAFHVRDRDEDVPFSDALEIHVLELPKLKRQPPKSEWDPLELWCLYLNNTEGEIMERIATQEPLIKKAMTVEDVFTKNEEERRLYELREKGRRDFESALIFAKREGKLETARSMLADAMAPDLIAKFTGLSIEEIEALREKQD